MSRIPDEEVRFISHHREEFLFVTRGTLECLLQTPDGPARETLSPGDCIYFWSHLPHCLRAATDEGASAIEICTRRTARPSPSTATSQCTSATACPRA